ncbi:MAG: hypothetical protein BIFFINMI_00424 [Phycisphaerae bacterium]|nr:hypothetical protein [Phycisphaerae bacterium]
MGTLTENLQQYDQLTRQLYQLRDRIRTQQRRSRIQERKVAEHDQDLLQLRQKLQAAQSEAGAAELELKSREESIQRLRAQLNTTKTNKEYSALLREINTFKADSGGIEETALRKMAEVDELKGQLADLQKVGEQEKTQLAKVQSEAQAKSHELENQLAQIQEKRRQAAAGLPGDIVAQFERLAEANDGDATASVAKVNPKRDEYICSGCNMGLTLETINALRSGREDVQTCGVCGRLLYLGDSAR